MGNCSDIKILENIFKKYCNNLFIINHDGNKLTYGDFWINVDEYANKLSKIGCVKRDVIFLKLKNSIDYLCLYIACMKSGIIACPIDPDIPDARFLSLKNEIKPRLVIDSITRFHAINHVSNTIKYVEEINKSMDCIMLFTSGTTGRPKGIIHSVRSLIDSAKSFAELSDMNCKTIVYHHFPMFYMAGVFNMFLCAMVSGGKIVLGKRFSSIQMLNFWDIPMKHNVNHLTLTPTMAISLSNVYREDKKVKYYINTINSIVCTGSYLHNTVTTEFKKVFSKQLLSCYGVTEIGGTITYKSLDDPISDNNDAVGKYSDDTKIKCNGDKKQAGEIYVKTPFMMSGYFVNGKLISGLDNGYFPTGDLGYIENKVLFVTGRKGDTIKKGGEFVNLAYIENIFMNCEFLKELSIVAIEDIFWGNKIILFYILKDKLTNIIVDKNIKEYGRKYLMHIEMPDKLIEVETIPKTSVGKIKKRELIDKYLE